jgi:hypothetical protein
MTFSVWRVALRKRGDLYGKRGGSQKKIQGKIHLKNQVPRRSFIYQEFEFYFLKK